MKVLSLESTHSQIVVQIGFFYAKDEADSVDVIKAPNFSVKENT